MHLNHIYLFIGSIFISVLFSNCFSPLRTVLRSSVLFCQVVFHQLPSPLIICPIAFCPVVSGPVVSSVSSRQVLAQSKHPDLMFTLYNTWTDQWCSWEQVSVYCRGSWRSDKGLQVFSPQIGFVGSWVIRMWPCLKSCCSQHQQPMKRDPACVSKTRRKWPTAQPWWLF